MQIFQSMKHLSLYLILLLTLCSSRVDAQELFWITQGSDSLCFMLPRVGESGKVAFAGCKNSTILRIPDSVTHNGKTYEVTSVIYQALTGNRKITELHVPGTVKVIESSAFEGCINLKKISLSEGLAEIGDYVFQDCTSLKDCVLPQTVSKLGEAVFRGCDHLKSIVLPQCLTEIPYKMFMGCFKLQSVNIPASVKHIGDYAFCNCTMLRQLSIPDSAKIEKRALQGCSAAAQYTNRIKQ